MSASLRGEENALTPTLRVPDACAGDMLLVHGVFLGPLDYAPLFGDMNLVAYLASLGHQAAGAAWQAPVVLPIYAAEKTHFRRGHTVFVSTGLILAAENEQQLIAAIRADMPRISATGANEEARAAPACSMVSGEERASLADLQQQLAGKVRAYAKLTTPALKRR